MASLSFRGKNDGLQVGDYRGSVTAEFHLPAVRPETPPSPLSTVPFPRDPDFVSRDKLLHSIREKNSVPGSRIALIGLGGVGKSQLAIEYSYLVRSEFPATWVFWIHASNQARFEQSFRDIADHIQVQGRHDPNVDIFKLVENWLRDEKHGKWICILDNADDEKLLCSSLTVGKEDPTKGLTNAFTKPLLEYVPRSQNGSTIITSRTREVVLKLVDRKDLIEVRPMETPEALELLQKKLQQVRNSEQSQQLVDTLEFMPLAIVQAASYIRHRAPRYSVSQYLSDFQGSERKATQLLKEEVGHLYRDWEAKNSILVAWQISFEYIRRIKLSAADLLSFMSFFDQQEIPENIIRHQIDARYISILELLNELSDGERSESDIGSEFEDDIRTLRDFSFITTSKDGSCFMMNRLVQLATRVWLKSNGQTEEWREKFISTLCHEFAPGGYKNWEKCRLLFPHVKSSISQKPESPEHLLEWADLLYRGAWYASDCGLITDMREMAWKSRKHRVNILGVENEASLKSSAMLAEAYSLEGRWEEAEQLEVQVMETRKTKLGDDHPDTLTSMANLASTYRNQGRWGEAEQLEVQVMETRRMELGEDYPDTLMSMANMASTYWNQGRWEEAEQLGLQVMETRKQVLGDDHPDTLISMANLASTYWNQGRWEEAEQLEVQVMETRKTKLGDDHSDTLISMANLASTYWNQGRWEEAEQLEVQVMETCKTKLGDDHPDTLTSMANLASTYQNQGRWEETEQLEVHVMETRTIKLGEDHPDTLTSIASLASMYRNQGRWQEAEQLGLQVMETRKQVLGDDHPHTLTSMANLVSTYWNQGRWEEAEQLEVQVMETRKTKLGGDHPDTLTSIASLASMYRNQGRWQEAEQFEAQVMETRKTKLGPHYSDSVDFVHSDSSSENDSVFSVPVSITSTRSLDSGRGEMNSLLIREFANLLHDDGDLLSLLLVGLSKELIGFERMRNNFRRMLKHFANNLNADILSESHRDLRSFVSSYSAMITRELFAMAPIDKERNIKPHVLEAGHRIASAEKRLTHERKVEFYLQDLHRDGPAPRTSESIGIFNSDDEESDQDSVAEEAGEDEPYEGSLQNLDRMRYFILESAAYQILRRRLEGFVRPSLHSRARDLVTRWSAPGHKNYGDVARYNLRNLISELQHVNPHEIQFERDRNTCRFFSFVGHYQYMIERWTGEPWDWWPLPHCPRALAESEARLQWKCACGDERWAEIPNYFARRLQSIIKSLPIDNLATQTVQTPPEAHTASNRAPCSVPNNSLASNRASHQDHRGQEPAHLPSNPSILRQPSGAKTNIVDTTITRHRVLFLAKQGGDYRLSQIGLSNTNSHTFFITMRKEYFRLRGIIRGRFSVWRYSHCDFYKFEKFDDHEFAVKVKDSFPEHANTDYEYQPRPMEDIPPISEHEFTKRFYACQKPRPLLHLHHKCRRLGAHSSDILKFLPKKRTELEEAGDKREDFWGIYARESISLRWIIFYNFACFSPFLAFFFAWIVPRGLGTDLQDPSIPLSIMISMLSLFWSVFLSSLQFGSPH